MHGIFSTVKENQKQYVITLDEIYVRKYNYIMGNFLW